MRKVYIGLLSVGLIVGAPWALTNALFSDSDANASNVFTTGTVDISTTPASGIVTYSNMAPGDVVTDDVTVANDGSLAYRYAISSTATNADSKALKDQLVLAIRTVDADATDPCDAFDGTSLYSGDLDDTAGVLVGSNAVGSQAGDRTLAAGASEILCFRVSLPGSTGNAYQDATTTATFTFDAEQTTNN